VSSDTSFFIKFFENRKEWMMDDKECVECGAIQTEGVITTCNTCGRIVCPDDFSEHFSECCSTSVDTRQQLLFEKKEGAEKEKLLF